LPIAKELSPEQWNLDTRLLQNLVRTSRHFHHLGRGGSGLALNVVADKRLHLPVKQHIVKCCYPLHHRIISLETMPLRLAVGATDVAHDHELLLRVRGKL